MNITTSNQRGMLYHLKAKNIKTQEIELIDTVNTKVAADRYLKILQNDTLYHYYIEEQRIG